jgi:16S rRNA (cytosine967-C5)-methyltransferase
LPDTSIASLIVDGVTITPHERLGMLVVQPTPHHLLRDWSENRIAQAQDATSAAVPLFCDVQPGMNVLDRCCGLGTKTLQLREQLGDTGSIVAIDPDPHRIGRLREIVAKQGFTNIHIVQCDRIQSTVDHIPPQGFDRVLIDAPCSNSGVLARRSAARYFQSDATLACLEKLQFDILTDTAPAVAPRGLLIYSTCSVWPEENERMVERFLRAHPEFSQRKHLTTLPSFGTTDPTRYHDGGYVAVLKRN